MSSVTLDVQKANKDCDDSEYATSLTNLAAEQSAARRDAPALELCEQTLAFRRRVLPADHPHIATAMLSAASSYSNLGRHAEALDHREQTLAIRRRVLPADHPDMAIIMFLVAISLANSGTMLQCSWFAHESLRIFRYNSQTRIPACSTF